MKRFYVILCTLVLIVGGAAISNAAVLQLTGPGGDTLLYDSELDVTYLRDANYAETIAWPTDPDGFMININALNLIAELNAASYLADPGNTWRLPVLSELAHLYNPDGITFNTSSPFQNLGAYYWLDDESQGSAYMSFSFYTTAAPDAGGGLIGFASYREVLPVFDGQWSAPGGASETPGGSAVPIPGALLLFGSGLAGLAGVKKKFGQN